MRKYYLAVDLGTTGCRSIVFDETLQALGASYEEYPLSKPHEKWAEQDAEDWWKLTLSTAKAAIEKARVDAKGIEAISVSSQGITIVPVDEKYMPLRPAVTWLDERAETQVERLKRDIGSDAVYRLTGKPLEACYTLPKILWLMENEPQVFAKTHKLLMPMEYLIGRLCGEYVTDPTMASGTLLYDLAKGEWSGELMKKLNIPESLFPKVCPSGSLAGKVLPNVAEELGLSEACVVAVGAQDQKCAAFGAGLSGNRVTVSLGTACAVTKQWDISHHDTVTEQRWHPYICEGTFVTEGVCNVAGAALHHVRELLFSGETYAIVDAEAEAAMKKGGLPLFFPKTGRGTDGMLYGVSLATDRGGIAAATMIGIAHEIRRLIEAEHDGTREMILFGGGAKSALWCQIIADVTGLTVRTLRSAEAASAGAARLAAKAKGEDLPSLETCHSYNPSENSAAYGKSYQKYTEIAEAGCNLQIKDIAF